MKLTSVSLQNFRNHRFWEHEFTKLSTVVVGPNTAGKTNILEAIYLLAMGESFREGKVEEMVGWGEELGRVQGLIQQIPNSKIPHFAEASRGRQIPNKSQIQNSNDSNKEEIELEVVVTRGVVQGKRVAKRRYLVNGVGRSKAKLVGNLLVVSFRPEDLRIVEGSPGRRRRMMDEVLVQVDREYARSLSVYQRALVRRNKLLWMIREGKTQRTALAFWDQTVVKHGELIQEKRREWFEFLNQSEKYREFGLSMVYEVKVISEKRMREYTEREVMAGHTLIGPHRDDFVIKRQATSNKLQEGRDLAAYGSRGEQRLGVLWLKMQTMEFMQQKRGQRPVLLLDDIFSELDREHRELVFLLFGKQQTIVTTADEHDIGGLDEGVEKIEI